MNRRESLTLLAGTALAASTSLLGRGSALAQAQPAPAAAPAAPAGPFTLPPLGYAYEALEPNIDAHDNEHPSHASSPAFITNLNNLVTRWDGLTGPIEAILSDLSKVPEAVRTPVRNNLGGHWNHTFFWDLMTPGGAKEPSAN